MTRSEQKRLAKQRCWQQGGVWGDKTCPHLETHGHCNRCPVYALHGLELLDREPPPGYVESWASLLTETREGMEERTLTPVLLFRLANEWFGLPTQVVREIAMGSPVHSMPFRSNRIFLGLVNVRGELHLCVSLHELLELPQASAKEGNGVFRRMIIMEEGGQSWVFAVDEVQGIHRYDPLRIQDVPLTVSKASATYTRAILPWEDRSVGILDEHLLFPSLARYTR